MTRWAGEFDYIRSQLAPLSAEAQGSANLTDDGAVLDIGPGERLALSADTVIEGRHFPKGEDPALAARKALRVNLSDLASMGARPFGYTTSVVWPFEGFQERAQGFVDGLRHDQELYRLGLVGGDTTRAISPWTISITAFGRLPDGVSLRRNRARAEDVLVVTGTIGDSGLGLETLTSDTTLESAHHLEFLRDRYRLPQPRIEIGLAARGVANAAIDISDGLLSEAHHIAKESGLEAIIELDAMPLSSAATAWLDRQSDRASALTELATHGDDYELMLAVPEAGLSALQAASQSLGVPLSVIGGLQAKTSASSLSVRSGSKKVDPKHLGFTQF